MQPDPQDQGANESFAPTEQPQSPGAAQPIDPTGEAPVQAKAEGGAQPAAGAPEKRRRRNRRRGKGGGKGPTAGAVPTADQAAVPADGQPPVQADKRATPGGKRNGQGAKGPKGGGGEKAAALAEGEDHKLQKLLAEAGLGSRRDMEEAITAGRVSVNGKTATLGQRITRRDVVRVDGKPIRLKNGREAPEVLIYHKPTGEIVSHDDPEGRPAVFDSLPPPKSGRWVAVGRLDFNTEGLLILTNSGDLANRLMHPRYEVEREYSVRVVGELTDDQTDMLLDGVELEDGPARFMKLDEGEFSDEGPGVNRWYRVMIREGRNREVRRMFEKVGVMVSRLIRTRFGPISLPRGLRRGQARPLTPLEVKDLLKDAPGGSAAGGSRDGADMSPGMPVQPGDPGRRKVRGKPQGRRGNGRPDAGSEAPGKRAPRAGPGRQAPAGRPARGPGAKKQGGKGPAKRAGKRVGMDRGSLTLDGRRAAKPRRRDDDFVPPPPPQPIITHRRSRLKIMPPDEPKES
jgi:23S rRNA pseudouridine2605 synthase